MKAPLEITFRGLPKLASVEARIRGRAAKLERFFDRIVKCDVHVEATKKRSGLQFDVRIDLVVPGAEIAITHAPGPNLDVAVRDAFDAAVRRLEGYAQRLRGDAERHAAAERFDGAPSTSDDFAP